MEGWNPNNVQNHNYFFIINNINGVIALDSNLKQINWMVIATSLYSLHLVVVVKPVELYYSFHPYQRESVRHPHLLV